MTRRSRTRRAGALRVGTSGYHYAHWRGRFYPAGLPSSDWLRFYAAHFDTVEINSTFYGLPTAETVERWRAAVPKGFRFALKFSRYGTHVRRLRDPAPTLERFLASVAALGVLTGPALVQLPPRFPLDLDRLGTFLDALPDDRRWALEFRDPSWLCDPVYEMLHVHGVALCVHDALDAHPRIATATWLYRRFHGRDAGGPYPHQALVAEARRIENDLDAGRDVYAYFNNDAEGFAVLNATQLRRYVAGA